MHRVRKLVLPVAGLGVRLRPLTLRKPKALVPLNGDSLLDYVLREGEASGIRDIILVVNPSQKAHFERYIKAARHRFRHFRFFLRFQDRPIGNGHAILQATDLLRGEPFAVRFCDDLLFDNPPVLASLIRLYEAYRAPIFLLERVPKKDVSRYGVVGIVPVTRKLGAVGGKVYRVISIVEKPKPQFAPSSLTIVGGYVLTPEILRNLEKIAASLPVAGNDALPLAVALQVELIVQGKLYGWEFPGLRLDCGTLEGLKRAEEVLKKRVPFGS